MANPVLKLMEALGSPQTVEEYLIAYYLPDVVPNDVPAEVRQEAERALGDTGSDAQRTDESRPKPAGSDAKPAPGVVRPVVRARPAEGRRG